MKVWHDMKRVLLYGILLAFLSGCAGSVAFHAGQDFSREGKYDEAVAKFSEAVELSPLRHEYRTKLLEARADAAKMHLGRAREYMTAKEYAEAVAEYRLAIGLDKTLEVAALELRWAEELIEAGRLIDEAGEHYKARRLIQARKNLERALQLDPGNEKATELLDKVKVGRRAKIDGLELELASDQPVTLKFKDTDIRDVFNILSRLSGINFIFDEDIKSTKVTILLEDATFAQALELLVRMNKLGKKVLNPTTIILYPKTKDKEKLYEEQLIETFYLSSIDAKKAVNLLRTMLQLRKVYVHEELNALVIRGTPDEITLARQMIDAADRPDSEVMFDLELVEVSHGDTMLIGPKLSNYAVDAGLGPRGGTNLVAEAIGETGTTTNLVTSLNGLNTFYTLPKATFDLAKTLTDSEVLANPRIRVKNKDKAKVHIGTKEPVITVTTSGETTTDNIQYVDVGVKLDVEPAIQLDNTVVTKLSLEVSSVSDRQTTTNGSVALTITTTNAQTALTLRDGEQTIIGGLIRDDFSKTRRTFPFLGDVPIIGDLITSHDRKKQKREILLSITPHIVKAVDVPSAELSSLWSGSEDELKAGPLFGSFSVLPEEEVEAVPSAAQKKETPLKAAGEPTGKAVTPVAPTPGQRAPEIASPSFEEEEELEELTEEEEGEEGEEEGAMEMEEEAEPGSQILPATPEEIEQVKLEPLEIPALQLAKVFATGPTLVRVGEDFAVDVAVSEIEGLYSAPLFVSYDADKLDYIRAEEGEFLKRDGQATVFTASPNPARGQLIIGYKQGAGGTGSSGSGTLFRLFFRGKAPGTAQVKPDRINFRDLTGSRLELGTEGLTVEVR